MKASPDGFYLGFACHGCKKPIEIIIDDASDGCRFVAEDVLQILCPAYGHRGHYATDQVQRYPGRPQSEDRVAIVAGVNSAVSHVARQREQVCSRARNRIQLCRRMPFRARARGAEQDVRS
jgi:hypothetical protein